jgi:DNA invertase Pin-like site-specific DNA recombinase
MSQYPGREEWGWYTEKIRPQPVERLAVVYVRQSTMQQVLEHQESTRLQYGLVQRAVAWGWSEARVLVIDDDLGRSGTSAEGRHGFQRLVAEVGLDHVGLIRGVEMSRLARSSKDWHQLLEICALFGTLIADLDGIDDPSQYNDRLLLGLKGTMSEAELHLLRQRMYQGTLQKARRGALRFALPIGYVHNAAGAIVHDPDEQDTWCGSSCASLTNSARCMRSYAIWCSTIFSLGSASGKALSRGRWSGAGPTA